MKPQPPVTRIRTAPDTSSAAKVKPHTTPTKDTKVATINENEVAKLILDAEFLVHTKLGPGFESVYEVVLAHELRKMGLFVERQKPMSIYYDGIQFDEAFRSDLVVNGKVAVELKSVAALSDIDVKQVLTQLR